MTGILHGIRVPDLSRMLSGSYCTMMLADHRAEVIKIEGETGGTSRQNGRFRADDPNHDRAGYYASLNRSKKSVQLDLKTASGKAAFRALARFACTRERLVDAGDPDGQNLRGLLVDSQVDPVPDAALARFDAG